MLAEAVYLASGLGKFHDAGFGLGSALYRPGMEAAAVAQRARAFGAELVVGLPTLGLAFAPLVATGPW